MKAASILQSKSNLPQFQLTFLRIFEWALILLILAVIAVTGSSSAFAGEEKHDTNAAKQTEKYDYGAVCDFISARLYEVEKGIAEDSGSHISQLPTQLKKSLKGFRYRREGISANFLISGSKTIATLAHLDAKAIYKTDRKKNHLLSRLGMDINDEARILAVTCDDETLSMTFSGQDLTEVDISVNFID